MDSVNLNWLAILVAGVINMVIGAIWYSPMVFGKTWMKEMGMKEGDAMGGKSMVQSYLITFIGALLMGYALAMAVAWQGGSMSSDGMMVAFWLWLGFAIVIPLNDVIFGKKTWNFWMLNGAYYLVVLLVNGALLATWH